MKKEYPNYKVRHQKDIKDRLKLTDKRILKDFLIYCGSTAGKKKLINYERYMLQIRDVSEIPYNKWNLKKLREFLAVLKLSPKSKSTKNDIKKILKRFLSEQYKDHNTRFNKFKDIGYEDDRNHDKLNPDTILNKEQIEKIIRKSESLRWKAMVMLMFESGGRTEEILNLKWSDVDLNKEKVKLKSSKTGKTRVNPLRESIIHLRRYKQEYPYLEVQASDYVFPTHDERGKPISNQLVNYYFRDLGKKAINKHLFPYLLRHSRLTPLLQELSPKAYEKFSGHSLETGMRYYGHLSSETLDKEILEKIYHVEELTPKEQNELLRMKKGLKKVQKEMKEMRFLVEKGLKLVKVSS